MIIRLASMDDFNDIKQFYYSIIDQQQFDQYGADWHKDIYPCDEDYNTHLKNNEYYIGLIDDKIVSAAVLTDGDDPIYQNVNWKYKFSNEEITVLHLFAVSKDYRGKNISTEMLNGLFEIAKNKNKKVVHLDVVYGNLPAERLYKRLGFEFNSTLDVYYEDTGDIKVNTMEYLLK